MRYALFIGGRIGSEALEEVVQRVQVVQVFLEPEHAHEVDRYSERIRDICAEHNIPCTSELQADRVLSLMQTLQPDYLMCFGYRRMISDAVMACAKVACVGSHFAPLPRYRGFAPLNWVLINGEPRTAVNIFFLADEVDAGDIIARQWVDITEQDDINTLTDKCVLALGPTLEKAIAILETGTPTGEPQNHAEATFTCSRNPEDGWIDWRKPSAEIYNLVRALTYPMPGAFTSYEGRRMYVWACEVVDEKPYEGRVCGKVIAVDRGRNAIKVLTGDGSLWITQTSTDPSDPTHNEIAFGSVRVTLGQMMRTP